MELNLLDKYPEQASRASFMVGNTQWSVTGPHDIANRDEIPEYTCISYSWGPDRVSHPFRQGAVTSRHTLPALAAAISNDIGRTFWIDDLCIPTDEPSRQATLESMGFIYSHAKYVVVALSDATFAAIKEITQFDKLDDGLLDILERDEWVTSVWTYQEVINSSRIYFVCETLPRSSIDAVQFFNRVGYSLQQYRKRHSIDGIALAERFPHLSTMEDLFADWMLINYMAPFALQIMTNMDRRVHRAPTNYFYSMIGAVTQEPSSESMRCTVADLAELFMAVCEKKNDYSFIYSATDRDTQPGRRWRPIPAHLASILPWHCSGEAQRAYRDSQGLWLADMLTLRPTHTLNHAAKEIITRWLSRPELSTESDAHIAECMYSALKRVGFKGGNNYVIVEGGLFFPWRAVQAPAAALVAKSISWVFGAPGLLVQNTQDGTEYVPGVFAGSTRATDATAVLLV
jgi:hypothetical protein